MTRRFPPIMRGTREYDETVKILGLGNMIADESVVQISNRWLKGDQFQTNHYGDWIMNAAKDDVLTRRVRIRIPKGSYLTRRR